MKKRVYKNPSIILMGAAGTGKTTLVRELHRRFNLAPCYAPTTEVEERFGGRSAILTGNSELRFKFQRAVAEETCKKLLECIEVMDEVPFAADRGLDFLMYEAIYGKKVNSIMLHDPVYALMRRINHINSNHPGILKIVHMKMSCGVWKIPLDQWENRRESFYCKRDEVLKQEVVTDTVLGMCGLPYISVEEHQVSDYIYPMFEKRK